eukprot:325120-Chlamydomonas_euryale.AAC.2
MSFFWTSGGRICGPCGPWQGTSVGKVRARCVEHRAWVAEDVVSAGSGAIAGLCVCVSGGGRGSGVIQLCGLQRRVLQDLRARHRGAMAGECMRRCGRAVWIHVKKTSRMSGLAEPLAFMYT